MIYLRYEFNDKEQADSKIAKLDDVNAAFIKLNKFVLEEGAYNEEEEELTAPVLSDGYAMDVVWYDLDKSPYGWKSYEVEPSEPKHKLF